ncbi:MAG: MOSC domain-containing protein [Pseudomonadaceae bacterium]
MTEAVTLLSINAAEPQTLRIGERLTRTGHFKQARSGEVQIGADGIAGDFIADMKHHGGPDQAVYLYSQSDIDWWSEQLQRPLEPGFFGENLTLSHWWPELRIGDRLRIGELLLEITAPRIPCSTLAARVGDARFVKAFVKEERCGAYARVVDAGTVSAGQTVTVMPGDSAFPGINEVFRYCHSKGLNPTFLRRLLAAPVAEKMRAEMQQKLAKAEQQTQPLPGF